MTQDTLGSAPSSPLALPIQAHMPWLAPLAGYSDLTFRLLCREHGARIACTEMVSAKGLVYKSNGTQDLLATTPEDSDTAQGNFLVVQLFGNEVPFMQQALTQLLQQGFQYFDLNMGCSVPKVNKTGCGSAMLKDVDNSLAVAQNMINLVGKGCMGFKIRLGWTDDTHVWQDLALALQELGAGWITLHPRTARQGFSGDAAWQYLAALRQLVHIPVIASGDLFTPQDGVRCLKETGVSTVMYARGAMQNPCIFQEHTELWQEGRTPQVDAAKLMQLISRHMQLARAYSSERVALLKMRTFVPRYVHHFPGVKRLRQEMAGCASFEELQDLLQRFFAYALQKNEQKDEQKNRQHEEI